MTAESRCSRPSQVECSFYVVEIRATVVDYCPGDAAAVLCREMRLDCHHVTKVHCAVHMSKPPVIITIGPKQHPYEAHEGGNAVLQLQKIICGGASLILL